jgi:hypothetical protein
MALMRTSILQSRPFQRLILETAGCAGHTVTDKLAAFHDHIIESRRTPPLTLACETRHTVMMRYPR